MASDANNYRVGASAIKICRCGQVLIFTLPEHREMFRAMMSNPDISLVIITGISNDCPKCGMVYRHPPAEAFELVRQPFGLPLIRLAEALNSKSEGE